MEFTPTEEQIKFVWSQKRWDHMKVSMGDSEREFDRWLNEERAKAWDESHNAYFNGIYENRYRKADR